MMKKRGILTVILITSLCLSFFIPANANPDLTTEEKADVLNQLDILKGTNGDYKLNDQLKRSEAAAFIVRIMGKENHVLLNKEDYWGTRFPDVISTQWYAPYVGYCAQQDIISGGTDGYYKPNNTISEKAFLKLVLGALGYVYNTDFTWSEVYSKAFYVGLVDDQDYLSKTEDNLKYTRGDVVDVLYNALTKVINGTEVTLIQSLVDDGIITAELAESTGLLDDDGVTPPVTTSDIGIEQLLVLNRNSIFIQFSETVEEIAAGDIKIYETDDFTSRLDATVKAKQPDTIVIETSDQEAYIDYTIEISNVRGAESDSAGVVTGTFTGYKAAVTNSEFFRIKKVEPVSNDMIDVYFTHPVNINSEIAAYYEILEGDETFASGSTRTLTAVWNSSTDNAVTVSLKGKVFTEGTTYTLKVSGDLTSVYTVKLNDGEGDGMRFTGSGVESEAATEELKLVDISLLDYKTLQLEFNREIHPTRAQQIFSYYITELDDSSPVAISKAVVTGTGTKQGKLVHISITGAFVKTENYRIMINEINDISRRYSIIEKEYAFSGKYSDTVSLLNIKSVTAIDSGTVAVYFNKPLDETTAVTNEYYTVKGVTDTSFSTIPAKVFFDAENDSSMVKLYLPTSKTLVKGKTYKLTVLSVMKDYMGNTALANREATFSGSSTESAKPYISDAVIISKDTIKVTFSKEIAVETPNILASNYYLDYLNDGATVIKVPLIAGYINSTTLVLKFDVLDLEKEYTLKFKSLKDYSGLYTTTAADKLNSAEVRLGE